MFYKLLIELTRFKYFRREGAKNPTLKCHMLPQIGLCKFKTNILPVKEKPAVTISAGTCKTKPIKCQCRPNRETSQLICKANKLTDFCMRATLALNGLISLSIFRSFLIFLVFVKIYRILNSA